MQDKGKARKNLDVYSISEIDNLLAGKLGTDSAYSGVIFTAELRDKLQAITTGAFAYVDDEQKSHSQVEGYALVSAVAKELKAKAERLLSGYNASEQNTVAANLNLYTKVQQDSRFAKVESLFQDYITYLVSQGKNTEQALQLLREKLNLLSKDEVVKDYLRRDSKLTDLLLTTVEAKRQVCRTLGAAYADDYQRCLPIRDGCRWRTAARVRIPWFLRPPDREYCVYSGVYQYSPPGRKQLGRHYCSHSQQNSTSEVQCTMYGCQLER